MILTRHWLFFFLAWTVDELSLGQPHDWRTHRHTYTHTHTQATTIPEGQNWPRVKMRNISRPWPNLSSSDGSQDTSACQISGHYCHAFSIKYGNHTFEMFHWVKMPPKLVKSTDRDQNLIRSNLIWPVSLFWPVWPWNLPYDLENLRATSSRFF